MDWYYALLFPAVIFVIAALSITSLRASLERKTAQAEKWYALLTALTDATERIEPKRPDANDPLRQRYVFCGRWVEIGHSPECPWFLACRETYR